MKPILIPALLILCAMVACGGGSTSTSTSSGGGSGTQTPPGAISWQSVSTPFSTPHFIDFGSNGHWFVADRSQGFYRSTDGGSTWSPINSGVATTFGWTINVAPGSGNLIAGIYSSGGLNLHPVIFYRSSDEGNTWTAIPSGALDAAPAHTGCVFAPNSTVVCGGYWAPFPTSGAWFSTNAGQTATPATTVPTNGTAVFALALNPVSSDLWMGTEQYGIFRSTDNGATWTAASPPDTQIDPVNGIRDGNAYAITFDRKGNVLFGSQGGIWKSAKTNSGFSWSNVKGNPTTADGSALARDANGTLYYGHNQTASDPTSLYCSTDDGNTWSACDSGMPQSRTIQRLAVNPADGKLYAIVWDEARSTGALYRTVNPVQ